MYVELHQHELDELSLLIHKDQLDKEDFLNDHIFMYVVSYHSRPLNL